MAKETLEEILSPPAHKCVLVVDDDPILREVMVGQLGVAGLATAAAESAEAALKLIESRSFDLAVVDIGLPGLDGYELLRCIRQAPHLSDLPVIVATSFNDPASIQKAYELGASSFVTKPINWPQFAHHVHFVMRSGENERALRAAEAEAVAASRMKNGLFQVLSHELKTPLTALIGLTGVLSASLTQKVAPDEAENLDHVVGAAQRLNGVVSDILILSKALAAPSLRQQVSCPLGDIVDDSIVGLKTKARDRGIALVAEPPAAGLTVTCDPQLMRQALFKLVDNAIKFSPPGGSVEIRAHEGGGGSIVISVRDDGPGLDPAALRDCLKPFIQDDMSYGRPADGLGLGLPIAKSIVESHGGELVLKTQPGQGVLAEIHLPGRGAARLRA